MKLYFRALLPNGKWIYQRNQYLTSFLRRVLLCWKVKHPAYLEGQLEDKLQIKINGKWIQCRWGKYKMSEETKKKISQSHKGKAKIHKKPNLIICNPDESCGMEEIGG